MKNRPFERPSLINLNNELEVYKESGSETNNTEETKKENNDDGRGQGKEQTKNMTDGNQIEVEGKIHTIRKKIIHYYDLSSEDDNKLNGKKAELGKKQKTKDGDEKSKI